MSHMVLAEVAAGISELKRSPMATVKSTKGKVIAILNRSKPVFYCVPAKIYESMIEALEDIDLAHLVKSREGEKELVVDVDDL